LNPDFVFVYGGLMRGFDLHYHMASLEFVGQGTIEGTLLALGPYPGLVDGGGAVRGEVYRVDDMPSALEVLDDVEDYNPTDPDAGPYVRRIQPVRMDDGRIIDAWVYRYNRTAPGAAIVPDGDWRKAKF